MSNIIESLKSYKPANEQEQKDLEFFLECEAKDQVLTRDNELCHLCSAAFVTNKNHDKVLCIFHNIYKSWTIPGGHVDGDDDALYVAKKETMEETSLTNFKVLDNQPVSIDSLPVLGHFKRGKYVPAHTHLVTFYLFEADENQHIQIAEAENSNIGWLTFDELLENTTEPYMIPPYQKAINKLKAMDLENNKSMQ